MTSEQMRQLETAETPEVTELREEVWRLHSQLAAARQAGADDMRKLALATYEGFAAKRKFTDQDVVQALKALTLEE